MSYINANDILKRDFKEANPEKINIYSSVSHHNMFYFYLNNVTIDLEKYSNTTC